MRDSNPHFHDLDFAQHPSDQGQYEQKVSDR